MTAYRKFSDIIRSRHLVADNVPPPKTPNQTDDDGQSARALGGLATFSGEKAKCDFLSEPAWSRAAGVTPNQGSALPSCRAKLRLKDTKVIAPSGWLQGLVPPTPGEPELDQPCEARRGRTEERDGVFLHFREVCGARGAFGYKVKLESTANGSPVLRIP